jgi:alpha-beta hydrolase superfamily lysophospholipase
MLMRGLSRSRLAIWLLIGALLIGGCSLVRGYQAAVLLADIAAGPGPSRLKEETRPPQRRTLEFAVGGRRYRGDLYRPDGDIRAGLVLVPGVVETGKDDPRLVAFATSLARAGFSVLVPDLAGLRRLQVRPDNITEIADAFAWLAAQDELVPDGRAGMAAFSYAAGPALLAALQGPIREKVRFILAVGGYHDMQRVLTFFTTGFYRKDGRWHYLKPNDYGKWAFVASNIDRLGDADDRRLFRRMALRKLADPGAPTDDLAALLGTEGRALYDFVDNRDPRSVPRLLAALPSFIREDVDALNPAGRDLSRLAARLILVHGLEDRMIPYTESEALAEAVPPGQAWLFLVHGLDHVDVAPELPDRWRLWRAIAVLLAARDGKL